MKQKIGNFLGSLLGYTIIFNVIFGVPISLYFWYKEHRRVTKLTEVTEEIADKVLVEKPDLD